MLEVTLQQKVELAERILKALGLDGPVPPLLVLLGHGSQSANNPQAAGLDCGACCGQSGEINARLLASLLNDTEVREGLRERGLDLPAHCHVLAGLHNTTTDEVQVFGVETLAQALQPSWLRRAALDSATMEVRRQRAIKLGLARCASSLASCSDGCAGAPATGLRPAPNGAWPTMPRSSPRPFAHPWRGPAGPRLPARL